MNKVNLDVRDKIIEAAYILFAEKGYPKTTINDIITKANCSKGGFYHHFANKDEVMDAIMQSYVTELEEELFMLNTENVIEALGQVVTSINSIKSSKMGEWPELIKILSFPDNEIFIRRMADTFSELLARLFKDIFEKGNNEGVFIVSQPDYLGALWARELLELYRRADQVIFEDSEELTTAYIELVGYIEQLLNTTLKDCSGKVSFIENMTEYVMKAKSVYRDLKNVIDL